jgi:predicted AAA+ superfamily ATPase
MIPRNHHIRALEARLANFPVVGILGARQVGKTTLARVLAERWEGEVTFFDLEDPRDLARLSEPSLVLPELRGLVVLDEIQRMPELFPLLRVMADRQGFPARFLILGSASPDLSRKSSESLAGRVSYYALPGLHMAEVGVENRTKLWRRGGFPRSYLAVDEATSFQWREDFARTFLERDLPNLGVRVPATTLRRFWQMLAHYHGQLWNGAELARAFGVSETAVRNYLDILTDGLVVRQLQPWFENISKRQVKSPRIFLADSGMVHGLLGLESSEQIEGHPKVGASWEGFVLEQLLTHLGLEWREVYFWATHAGAELDLMVFRGGERVGFEIKRTSSPSTTRAMHAAIETLSLSRLDVIHAGSETFPLKKNIRAVAFRHLLVEVG